MVQVELSDQERKILQAVADLSGTVGFAADVEIADETGLDLQTIRAYLDAFERRGMTRSANSYDGYAARLTSEGRSTIDADITDAESELLATISAMQPDSRFFVADTDIAARAGMALPHVRNLLNRLERKGLIRLAKSFDGYSAAITGEPDPARPGFGEYRLKERGVPIWAIIGSLTEDADNVDEVAEAYDLPREAVEAALAFYRRHHAAIDARLAQNLAS
jgi:Mn-dependent DtxR family transcriptional regulator/uncharacterized protein (DUF433 family)